jgi:hypothetical protein
MAPTRDHRADFMRGISLLFILWNHVFFAVGGAWPLLLKFTPLHWGFASSTEAFVFLSGYVYGIVYLGVAERFGRMAVWVKSALRAWQLYVTNIITMVLCLGLASWWVSFGPGPTDGVRARLFLNSFITPGAGLFVQVVPLYRIPWGFDVLALYIALLLLAPLYILLVKRRLWLAVAIGATLYTIAQFGVNIPAAHYPGEWYFNPFAWQLLFLIGIVAGARQLSVPRSRWLVTGLGAIIAAVALWTWLLPWLAPHLPVGSLTIGRLVETTVPWTDATKLEPVRLLHFLILALFVAALTRRSSPFWTRALARPVVIVGQFSLELFCFGLVYTYAAALLVPAIGTGWPLTALAALAGCVHSVVFAYLLHARRSFVNNMARRRAATP